MAASIDRGLKGEGILPGGLKVRRRAGAIHARLLAERGTNLAAPHTINDWISVYAIAVNEENAAGARVVTAPTNGAAGVVPATIRYLLDHVPGASPALVPDFLLTAAAIGGLLKTNASISGAEVGCQGEVGSAAAMAAAGLAATLGGTPEQVENAAEIALEHHLGMTCDPIAGLVQAPCIERNGLGAIKAVSAASLALRGDGVHLVSLDACIETMRQTGRDMSAKYKETSLGGLAVNVPAC
jgi:L-serine dehydratase